MIVIEELEAPDFTDYERIDYPEECDAHMLEFTPETVSQGRILRLRPVSDRLDVVLGLKQAYSRRPDAWAKAC